MKIFLAGAVHEVGKRVAYLLARNQHEVTAAVGSREEARILAGYGVKPLVINLLKVNDVAAALYGQDVVCNIATAAWNPKRWTKDITFRRAVSMSLAYGALKNKVHRFIQESSTLIYADAGSRGVTEDGTWKPGADTSAALSVERNALELEKNGTVSVVLRFASAYSADSETTRALLRYARFGYYMQPGSPDGFVSTIHSDDAATAVVEALNAPPGVYNVAEDLSLIRRESAQALATALGRSRLGIPSELVRGFAAPSTAVPVESLKVLNDKFKSVTTWKPKYPSPREGWKAVVAQASK
jgi:nucleoside-diphosphate-sugar epimerase